MARRRCPECDEEDAATRDPEQLDARICRFCGWWWVVAKKAEEVKRGDDGSSGR